MDSIDISCFRSLHLHYRPVDELRATDVTIHIENIATLCDKHMPCYVRGNSFRNLSSVLVRYCRVKSTIFE